MVGDVAERDAEMFQERHLGARLVVPGNGFGEDGEVGRFLQICHGAEYEPQRVVVEASADVVVSAARQRLVLVVAAAVGELCGCNVEYALAGTLGNLMYESHEVLIAVAESHASSHAAFEERC